MMNAEKSFKALVKSARMRNFKVSFFCKPDCGIGGNVCGASIRINSSRDYETRLKTLVLLLSKHDFFGMKNGYAVVESGKEAGGMSAHIALFAMCVAEAIQAG